MFCVPHPLLDFWPLSTVELLILCLPFGVHWGLLPVGRGCLLIVGHVKCRVCMWWLWMSKRAVDACAFCRPCVCVPSICAGAKPDRSHGDRNAAWYAYATRWYDYSAGCSLCFRLVINNLFEDFVNRCQDNKRQHRPLCARLPPPTPHPTIHLPFFSLINMEMSRSLLLVGKKAVMSLVTGSMDVFGLRGLLFSESMSYLCLGSESKM